MKIFYSFGLICLLSTNILYSQIWNSNPALNTYAICGNSGTNSCSFGNVLGNGIIKARVTSLNSTTATIQITKCSGTFSAGGTGYIKNSICNSNAYASISYASGASSCSITFTHGVTPGQSAIFYPTLTSSTTDRFYAEPITISATATPVAILSASAASISPSSLIHGEVGSISNTIYNTGNATFNGNAYLSLHSSSGSYITDLNTNSSISINAGSNYQLSKPYGVINSAPGSYQIITKYYNSSTSSYVYLNTSSFNIIMGVTDKNQISFSNITSSQATATWPSVPGAVSYEVKYDPSCPTGPFNNSAGTTSTNSITIPNLTTSTTYRIQVRALHSNGTYGAWSGSSPCFTTLGLPNLCINSTIYTNPTTFIQGQANTRSVVVKNTGTAIWNGTLIMRMTKQIPNPTDYLEIAAAYNISINPNSTYTLTASNNKLKSHDIGEYKLDLWKQNNGNWTHGFTCGNYTDTLPIFMVDPFEKTLFSFSNVGTTSARIHWAFKSGVDKSKITKYNVNITGCADPNYNNAIHKVNILDTFVDLTSLTPNTSYKFQVQGVYTNDQGQLDSTDWSGSISFGTNLNCFTTASNLPNLTAGAAAINPSPLVQGQNGSIANIIYNNSNNPFTGYVYLSLQNTAGGPPIDLNLNAGTIITIPAGDNIVLTKPSSPILSNPGSYLIETKYSTTNTPSSYITLNSTPINIVAPNTCGGCAVWTNPPSLGSLACTATSYLCDNNIIIQTQDGDYNNTTPMLRKELATMLYNTLFNSAGAFSDFFPQSYIDLPDKNAYYYKPALALSYLRYNDDITPFQRDKDFDPELPIARKYALKVFLEAFNIKPDDNGYVENDTTPSSFACDVENGHEMYGYLQKAKALQIINGYGSPYCACSGTCLNPDGNITREEAFIILYKLKTLTTFPQPVITNASFYIPHDITIDNIRQQIGKERGGFTEYAESGFNVNGHVPLNFNIWYDATKTYDDIPQYFIKNRDNASRYNFESLGSGWTHNYNSYLIIKKGNDPNTNVITDDNIIVRYTDGEFALFKYTSQTTFEPYSKGVYETLTWNGIEYQLKFKNQMVYHYSYLGNNETRAVLTKITDRFNNEINLYYFTPSSGINSGYPRLSSVQDPYGRSLNFEYTINTRPYLISKVNCNTGSITRSVSFTYKNLLSDLGSFTNAKNKLTTYNYSTDILKKHLLEVVTKPNGNKLYCEFDANRKLSKLSTSTFGTNTGQEENFNVVPIYTAGGTQTKVTKSMNPDLGNGNYQSHIQETIYNHDGSPISSIGENNSNNVTIEYTDPVNPTLPTKVTNNITNVITTFVYDNTLTNKRGNLTSSTTTGGSISLTSSQTYSPLNDIETSTDVNNIITYNTWVNGALTQISRNGITTTISPNPNGTIAQMTRAGVTVQFGQNSYGNTQSMNVVGTSIAATTLFDDASRPYQRTNVTGKVSKVTNYDELDNVVDMVDDYGGLNLLLHNGYDNNGNQTTQTSEGQTTTWEFDPVTDDLIKETFGGFSNQWNYQLNGKLEWFKNKNGNTFTQTYFPIGTFKAGWLSGNGYATFDYDAISHSLNEIKKGTKTINIAYDALQRPISSSYNDGQTNLNVGHTLNVYGSFITTNYPSGFVVTTLRNDNNQITETKIGGVTIHKRNYNANTGKETSQEWGGGLYSCANSFESSTGQLAARDFTNSSNQAIYYEHYTTNDNAGNHVVEDIMPLANLSAPLPPASAMTFPPNAINQVTTDTNGATMSYNPNGVQQSGAISVTADELDNILTISKGSYSATMEYDGLEVRRRKNNTRYIVDILDGNKVLAETDLNGNVQWYNIWSGNEIVCRMNAQTNQKYYPISSYNGSIRMWMNDAGTITHQYYYDADGNVLAKQEAFEQPYQFNGLFGIQTDAPDIVYMQARYYRPSQRRFISADPIYTSNAYAFAGNNPVMNVDPSGESALLVFGLAITAYGIFITGKKVLAPTLESMYFNDLAFDAKFSGNEYLANAYSEKSSEFLLEASLNYAFSKLTGLIKTPIVDGISTRVLGMKGLGLGKMSTKSGILVKKFINEQVSENIVTALSTPFQVQAPNKSLNEKNRPRTDFHIIRDFNPISPKQTLVFTTYND